MFLTAWALLTTIQADRWVDVGGPHGVYEEHVDRDSITRIGDKVVVWTRRNLLKEKAIVWHEMEFDCSNRTEAVLAYIRDDDGAVSHNVSRPHRAASPIPPGSAQERVFELVCR